MSENLYDLSAELALINDEIIDAEGEITPELEARLDDLAITFDRKVFGVTRWTLNLDARIDALGAEIKRLQSRKKSTDNLKTRLKEFMKGCMTVADKKKLEFDNFTVAVQKNPPSVEITDEDAIPSKYFTIIPEQKQINKAALLADLKALKEGQTIPGAQLITDRTNLRIR